MSTTCCLGLLESPDKEQKSRWIATFDERRLPRHGVPGVQLLLGAVLFGIMCAQDGLKQGATCFVLLPKHAGMSCCCGKVETAEVHRARVNTWFFFVIRQQKRHAPNLRPL